MTDFPNTGAPMWAGSQASPWDQVNEAQFIFDAFASRSIAEDRDLTSPPVSCANGARYLIAATATGAWAGHDGELAIAIGTNASNGWHFAEVAFHGNQLFVRDEDLLIEHNGSAWVTAPGGVSDLNDLTDVDAPTPGDGDLLSWDAALDFWVPVAAPVTFYRIGLFFTTAPTASEVLGLHVVTEAMTIPADFAAPDSKGAVGTDPDATFVLDVQRQVNGAGAFSSIGTITISTAGAFTLATSGGTAKSIAAGDVIKAVGPSSPDASIANVAITLVGTIDG